MSHTNKHKLSSNFSPTRKPYIAPCVMVETLTEDVNFLAGSGPKAGLEEFGAGKDLSSSIDDE